MMRTLTDNSVNCCVTSPPYFGLRDYGCDGQIGLEDSPEQFIARLVDVFREVKRVLNDDGTLWVNMGDSYAGGGGGNYNKTGISHAGGQHITNVRNKSSWLNSCGLKPKDLIGIPWMLAFALRADGWYLRQDIIWHKPNPMPESVTDRCTKAHEYIFLLTKSPRYYFDHEAMKEKSVSSGKPRQFGATKQEGTLRNDVGRVFEDNGLRNKRSVWSVNVKPYKEAHFATYPPELITPCILAGCPEGGTVIDPFGGSGTTAQIALQNKRNAILCELNPDYVKIIEKRLASIDPLFNNHE
jgi:DNA modification methylase